MVRLFYSDTFGRRLGQPGQFGEAMLATCKKTNVMYAVKIISKGRFTRHSDLAYHFESLRAEIEVMRRLTHPNIIELHDVFESVNHLYLVMECCQGGELFDRIKEQGSYSEKDASIVLRQICEGIAYMHENKIAHCDLKPDNFLFLNTEKNSPVKIIDFGMSKFVQKRKYFQVICGTPYYVAPEVIQGRYSEHCDMWSIGVVMFVMLFGYPPFYADQEKYGAKTDDRIFRLIQAGFQPVTKQGYGAHFPAAIPCSESAKDLISKLLVLDPARRWSAREALDHPWLSGVTASSQPILANVLSNLRNFQATQKFKQAVLTMMSSVLTESEIDQLKHTFHSIDENRDGTITQAELRKALQTTGLLTSANAESIQQLIALADVDGDGKLSYNELLLTAVQKRLAAKEERLWDAFCRLDLNQDGKVSVEELKQVLTRNEKDARALIQDVDIDGDGMVSYEEFLNMWKQQEEQEVLEEPSPVN